jgi:hypothetical protein
MVDQKNQQSQGSAKQQMTDPKGNGRRNVKKNQYKGDGEKKRDPDAVPILKYGPSNNFMIFKEALSKKALVEFGNLGKLIKLGYKPLPRATRQRIVCVG